MPKAPSWVNVESYDVMPRLVGARLRFSRTCAAADTVSNAWRKIGSGRPAVAPRARVSRAGTSVQRPNCASLRSSPPPFPRCSNLTPIFIGMHRNAPLSPCMKRVPGYTIPMHLGLCIYGSYAPCRVNSSTAPRDMVRTLPRPLYWCPARKP